MKKSFYIPVVSLLILFLMIITGVTVNGKSNSHKSFSKDEVGLKASEGMQHDVVFIASLSENDLDLDKAFFDLSFILFAYHTIFRGTLSNSIIAVNSASECVHHYHLPKYLLFHNLKISIS